MRCRAKHSLPQAPPSPRTSRRGPRRASGRRPARRTRAQLLTLLVAWPLLQSAGCVDIAQRSVVNGFFNAVNPLLLAALTGDVGAPAGESPPDP